MSFLQAHKEISLLIYEQQQFKDAQNNRCLFPSHPYLRSSYQLIRYTIIICFPSHNYRIDQQNNSNIYTVDRFFFGKDRMIALVFTWVVTIWVSQLYIKKHVWMIRLDVDIIAKVKETLVLCSCVKRPGGLMGWSYDPFRPKHIIEVFLTFCY